MSYQVRPVFAVGVLALTLFVGMGAYLSSLKPNFLCLQFTFTQASFHAILAEWKNAGIARYKAHFVADFPFLLLYGYLGYLVATRTQAFDGFSVRGRWLLAWALPGAALADATEDILHLYFLGHYPQPGFSSTGPDLYFLAGFAATLKFLLLGLFLGGVLYGRMRKAAFE